jgi:hypothetical protein
MTLGVLSAGTAWGFDSGAGAIAPDPPALIYGAKPYLLTEIKLSNTENTRATFNQQIGGTVTVLDMWIPQIVSSRCVWNGSRYLADTRITSEVAAQLDARGGEEFVVTFRLRT